MQILQLPTLLCKLVITKTVEWNVEKKFFFSQICFDHGCWRLATKMCKQMRLRVVRGKGERERREKEREDASKREIREKERKRKKR